MNSRVRVLDVTHVQPDRTTNPPPSHAVKLSLFDTLFIALPPIQRLFFYDGPGLPPFPSLVRSLQSSLAATLTVFTPLTGKITHVGVPSAGDLVVDCSPGAVSPGVRFVEAEYVGGADDMRRLAWDAEHDTEAFVQLVPRLEVAKLPACVLAVQVTRPAGAGEGAVAVGVTMHHAVADGQSLWQFMRAWAAASREGSPAAPGLVPPTFDREAIRHPKTEEVARSFVRLLAPALPKVNAFPEPDITLQSRRTYLLSAGQIESLKQRILQQSKAAKNAPELEPLPPPTTYVAISALVWTSLVRARSLDDADDAYFMFAADCRRRLRPPLDDGFFGCCVKSCYARATARDLRGGDGLVRASSAVRTAIDESLEDPLRDADRWVELNLAIPRESITQLGSSHRFMAYEIDFGWGEPSRVELVSTFVREIVMVVGARGGAVQVSVALDRDCIDAFQASFLSQVSA